MIFKSLFLLKLEDICRLNVLNFYNRHTLWHISCKIKDTIINKFNIFWEKMYTYSFQGFISYKTSIYKFLFHQM